MGTNTVRAQAFSKVACTAYF